MILILFYLFWFSSLKLLTSNVIPLVLWNALAWVRFYSLFLGTYRSFQSGNVHPLVLCTFIKFFFIGAFFLFFSDLSFWNSERVIRILDFLFWFLWLFSFCFLLYFLGNFLNLFSCHVFHCLYDFFFTLKSFNKSSSLKKQSLPSWWIQ